MSHQTASLKLIFNWLGLLYLLGALFCPLAGAEANRFQAAREAFDRGDFAAAYQEFHDLLQSQPGDPELDFLLGRSAFEIGDYEAAIFAFERVLIAQPAADRVRLELARSYFEIGDLESARSNFNRVLAKQPPATVQRNIERYLQLLDQAAQQHTFSGSLSIGLSYDDNVYASPADEEIQTVLGSFTLSGSSASPQEDLISQNSLQLNHLYRRHPQKPGWFSSLTAYSALYAGEEALNLNLVGISSGPLWQSSQRRSKLQLNFNYLTLDEERYLSIGGITAEHAWQPVANQAITLSGQLSQYNYANDERDADQLHLEYRHVLKLSAGSLSATLGTEINWAEQNEHSYLRKFLRIRYQRPLFWNLSGAVGVRLQATDYEGPAALFGKIREDRLRELSLGLSRPVWKDPRGGGQVLAQVQGVVSRVGSSIDLYEYDKQVVSFLLSYLF